jgi:branched-chain amino acid transport system substrate-binding protein
MEAGGKMRKRLLRTSALLLLAMACLVTSARAQKKYDPGASDTEVRIGNIVPYTGSFSEYGAAGRAEAAYFRMINDSGGVNGRKITFVSLDGGGSAGSPAELARQLVETNPVLFTVGIWGAPMNLAIRPYMNQMKVPQLFVNSTAASLDDPGDFPWTMGFQASKRTEGTLYARYLAQARPDAKIGVLLPDGATDAEWLEGLRTGLGEKAPTMIVKVATFSYSDPASIGAQIQALKDAGADVFMNLAVGRYATQGIRGAYALDWHPLQFIPNASLSITSFLDPAGLEKASGIVTSARSKGWLSPGEQSDPAVAAFLGWMQKYNPDASLHDANYVYGYEVAEATVEVLKRCGDNLTRANVLQQATHLDLELGMLRPGIRLKTSPTDYEPIKQLFLIQFDGSGWKTLGGVIEE